MEPVSPRGPAQAEDALRARLAEGLGLTPGDEAVTGEATLDSAYPVSDLAAASVTTAALAAAELMTALDLPAGRVHVDRALCDRWFGVALQPIAWSIPPPWDPIAGDYPSLGGGWVRLHTNAPHHRAAALRVLGVEGDREHVASAVARWDGAELEDAVVAEGGCAAVLRDPASWAAHPAGAAVAAEPLVAVDETGGGTEAEGGTWAPAADRPLAGLRVLDLTRVLAGPVATRLLAGLGADVLRIDPPGWDEPGVVPDMTVGKRTARVDARDPAGLETLRVLLGGADVVVHGYRSDALEHLGLGAEVRAALRPGLVDVALDAYGWTGPWATRRGFDSLVQMSAGIAGWGLSAGLADRPTPLPVQALDHATGYLAAAAVLTGIARRVRTGRGSRARLSLARTAVELESAARLHARPIAPPAEVPSGGADPVTAPVIRAFETHWGAATLPDPPFDLGSVRLRWDRVPRPLGSDAPVWEPAAR